MSSSMGGCNLHNRNCIQGKAGQKPLLVLSFQVILKKDMSFVFEMRRDEV